MKLYRTRTKLFLRWNFLMLLTVFANRLLKSLQFAVFRKKLVSYLITLYA